MTAPNVTPPALNLITPQQETQQETQETQIIPTPESLKHLDHLKKLASLSLQDIPKPLKTTPSWILWQPEDKIITLKDGTQGTKIIKKPLGGENWDKKTNSYEDIILKYKAQQKQYPVGLGFVLSFKHAYVCLDVDEMTPENIELIQKLDSYTEYSPSGKGVHVYLQMFTLEDKNLIYEDFGTKKFDKTNKRDLFISSGYVTITGDHVPEYARDIRLINYVDLSELLVKYFNIKITKLNTLGLSNNPSIARQKKSLTAEQVRLLLRKIDVRTLTSDIFDRLSHPIKLAILDPDEREEARDPWMTICQSVHHNFNGSADGLLLLHEWSKKGNKYDKEAQIAVYSSFSTDPQYLNQRRPVTIASLVALVHAQQPDFSDRTSKGNPMSTIQNLETYLKFYKYKMKYNLISMRTEVSMPPSVMTNLSYHTNQLDDIDIVHRIVSSELLKLNFTLGNFASLKDSLIDFARINTYNPVEEYFRSLSPMYDPTADPLEDLMSTIVIDPVYRTKKHQAATKLFIRKWLIQVVAAANTSTQYSSRIFNNILVFTGDQGIGKTKWVQALFPRAIQQYCAGSGNLQVNQFRSDNVKQAMELQRTLICNINEIDVLFKPKNYSAFKQLLDENTSNMVLPYGRSTTTMTRRTVFIGSTNKTNFLVDQTGNRRITVIPAEDLQYDHHVDIEQLWAHVMHWYLAGEEWWLDKNKSEDEEAAVTVQQQINNRNMYIGNELFVEDLDTFYYVEAPYKSMYKKLTFREIRNTIPSLMDAKTNGQLFKTAKNSFILWLKQTKYGEVLPKGKGTRVAQYYLVPPLRTEAAKTSFKQVADER